MLVWLGLNWDLVTGTISITDRRISEFIVLIDKFLLSAPYVTSLRDSIFLGTFAHGFYHVFARLLVGN